MSRKRNWRQYNKALVQRGSLTFLIDPKILKKLSRPPNRGGMGRPREFSMELIQILLLIKIQYGLTYRSLEGFARWAFSLILPNLKVPHYTLPSKRASSVTLPKLSRRAPRTILLDSSGLKVLGEGEWKRKIHGRGRPRKWLKIHLAVDAKTQEIVAEVVTEANFADSKAAAILLSKTSRMVKEVVADGAYDRSSCREAIKRRGGRALIPPPRNGRVQGKDEDRDDAIRLIRGLGNDEKARSIWGKLTGYSRRAFVETAFSRMKGLFGDRLFSKKIENQKLEISLRCLLLNKMMREIKAS